MLVLLLPGCSFQAGIGKPIFEHDSKKWNNDTVVGEVSAVYKTDDNLYLKTYHYSDLNQKDKGFTGVSLGFEFDIK